VIRRTHTSFGVSTAPASCSGTSPKSRSNSDAVRTFLRYLVLTLYRSTGACNLTVAS
jgi:hypothetical protein